PGALRSSLDQRSIPPDGSDETKEALHLSLAPVRESARRQDPGEQAAHPVQQQQALDALPSLPRPGVEELGDLGHSRRRLATALDEIPVPARFAEKILDHVDHLASSFASSRNCLCGESWSLYSSGDNHPGLTPGHDVPKTATVMVGTPARRGSRNRSPSP